MTWAIGDTYRFSFPVRNAGVPADADSLPTGQLIVNGTAASNVVTITKIATGQYRGSVPLTGLAMGDTFEVEITAIIGGVTYVKGEGEQRISINQFGVSEAEIGDATKLDAVNEMLEAIGLPAVLALDTNGTSEEAEAEKILDREIVRVLSMGWSCNTAHERTFTVSGGEIDMTGVFGFAGSKYGDHYTIKDGKLYDPVNDTSTFTASVTLLDVKFSLTYTQIPQHIQEYIIAKATLGFVRYKRQDIEQDRRYAAKLSEAKAHANAADARLMNVNITNTYHAARNRGFPYGRRV